MHNFQLLSTIMISVMDLAIDEISKIVIILYVKLLLVFR